MAKNSPQSTIVIERLLEERRQYEAWIARIDAAGDTAPENVRSKVRADYSARLEAVTEELKAHAEEARQLVAQKQELLTRLVRQEKEVADRLKESELRHAVGEYDEAKWTQAHKDSLAELMTVRAELRATEADIAKLEELDRLVRGRPDRAAARSATPPASAPAPSLPSPPSAPSVPSAPPPAPPSPQAPPPRARGEERKATPVDELAFLKSVSEDESGRPSARRASGAQFQPDLSAGLPSKSASSDEGGGLDGAKTLKCAECGTMNLPTEWYCEQCGSELAAL